MSEQDSNDVFRASGDDPLLGQTVQGRYLIEKKLGQGGMGAVYLAEHTLIKKKVAIKCLHAGLASNADVVRRFHNEAVAATAIGHPNIVDVTDMGRFDDGTFFMALEFLSGRDWQKDLDETGAQPLSKVAHIGTQICDALEAASSKGIVHRDLKPENIFLIERHGDHDFVKVLDFGISKFHDGIGGSTKTGELMGTPYYMAPEQVRGDRNISHVADIYSLGVIFFQALSGDVPFDGNTLPELILKIASQQAPRLDERIGDLPQGVIDLVAAMLTKTPHERPQTFNQVARALQPYLLETSRLSAINRSLHPNAFSATSVGGSAEEPSLGLPVPGRVRQATPFAARGPDTNAAGTPGVFGRTEASTNPPAQKDDHGATTSPHSITNPSQSPGRPNAKSSTGSTWVFAALAIVLVGGAGWFVSSANSGKAESESDATTSAQDTIRVQISTLPPDAELLLDGKPISNPFDGEFERDEARHELVASREGFEKTKKKLVLTAAQRIFIPMTALGPRKAEPEEKPEMVEAKPQPPKIAFPRPTATKAPPPAPVAAPVAAPPPAPAPAPTVTPAPAANPRDLKKIF